MQINGRIQSIFTDRRLPFNRLLILIFTFCYKPSLLHESTKSATTNMRERERGCWDPSLYRYRLVVDMYKRMSRYRTPYRIAFTESSNYIITTSPLYSCVFLNGYRIIYNRTYVRMKKKFFF